MTPLKTTVVAACAAASVFYAPTAWSQSNDAAIEEIRKEIQTLKNGYQSRIQALEAKIVELESAKKQQAAAAATPARGGRAIKNNSFNPSIGVILNGRATDFSKDESEIAGFAIGEEGERGAEGLSVDESELNFSANADDKFYGSLTAAIVREDGSDIVELEEAYIQTLPGLGLPDGLRLKAGRAFWTLGYLNEHHAHGDDFADRPLPYRVYLNNAFNDDGLELSWVLPTDFYTELGGGIFRGDDFPFGGSDSGEEAFSVFARVGGDIGETQSWRLGAYGLFGQTGGRDANEDTVTFIGDTELVAADVRYIIGNIGGSPESELILQGEVFYRDEDGTYEDTDAGTGVVSFDDSSFGWYAQAVYKFLPAWRVGARFSQLYAADVPAGLIGSALDDNGHDPYTIAVMGDWTSSEFGRVRLQYNFEDTDGEEDDHQFILQYIVSIGAHGAHAY